MNKLFCLIITCLLLIPMEYISISGQTKFSKNKKSKTKKSKGGLSAKEKKLLDDLDRELEENKPDKIYAFIGEKIEVKQFTPSLEKDEILMDSAFKAKYKIIQNVYGDYEDEFIEFEAYDHYGYPPFAKFKNVLLFVSEYKGKLYHEKYQYFDVYQTKNGSWAGCGDPYQFEEVHRKPVKTFVLDFIEPVSYDLSEFNAKQRKEFYPKPFYKIEGKKAICLRGAYIDELFLVKKNGVLKARRIF